MGKYLTNQNDQSNGPYFASKNNHPNNNGHVEINLSKIIEWFSRRFFKLGIFFTRFVNKKYHVF
jgi:hypothetical protein